MILRKVNPEKQITKAFTLAVLLVFILCIALFLRKKYWKNGVIEGG